jgi:hypothetical protein
MDREARGVGSMVAAGLCKDPMHQNDSGRRLAPTGGKWPFLGAAMAVRTRWLMQVRASTPWTVSAGGAGSTVAAGLCKDPMHQNDGMRA